MWLLERPVGGLLTPKRSWFLERLFHLPDVGAIFSVIAGKRPKQPPAMSSHFGGW
jgi:hypothetical protein